MLVALFAEDIGLLPKYFVDKLLEDCNTKQDSLRPDRRPVRGHEHAREDRGRSLQGGAYFNGGLFAEPARVELRRTNWSCSRAASKDDWSKVQPEIFGTLFEHSIGAVRAPRLRRPLHPPDRHHEDRRPDDRRAVAEADRGARRPSSGCTNSWHRLHHFSVLDPACGSGNFLYIAYRELKRLEARIYERIDAEFPRRAEPGQVRLSFLSARSSYGLDINPFAVEIAKVTMMIARKLAIDELHITEQALPLDNLDQNFIAADALIDASDTRRMAQGRCHHRQPAVPRREAAQAGARPGLRQRRSAAPTRTCRAWPITASIGFARRTTTCRPAPPPTPWPAAPAWSARRTSATTSPASAASTTSSRTGTIIEAVDNQPWSGEANVHVSIANWVKTQDAAFASNKRKLWFKVEPTSTTNRLPRRDKGRTGKDYELDFRETNLINASLSDEADITSAKPLRVNCNPKACFVGQYPFNEGFWLEPGQAKEWISGESKCADVLFPYMIGRDLVDKGRPSRWIIDFGRRDLFEASSYEKPFARVKALVMPTVLAKGEKEKRITGKQSTRWSRLSERWWHLRDSQPGTMRAVSSVPRYIACSRVTKRPIFAFVSSAIHPDNSLMVFPFADDYSFGLLQSESHWRWFTSNCSKLTERFRYTADTVFDTFPWPQSPTPAKIDAVAESSRQVRRERADALTKIEGGLRAVYRLLELPGKNPLKDAQASLDAAVLAAYGFSPKKDLLAQLLALNLEVAGREEAGEPVTAPSIPSGYPDPARLVTEDCIRAELSAGSERSVFPVHPMRCKLWIDFALQSLNDLPGWRDSMTTEIQAEANRRNALQSTGPKTGEGIEATRFNALRHGLRTLHTVVPGETPEQWEAHRIGVVEDLKPEGAVELALAEQIAAKLWRL